MLTEEQKKRRYELRRQRYRNDPEFRERIKASVRKSQAKKARDPEFIAKKTEYMRRFRDQLPEEKKDEIREKARLAQRLYTARHKDDPEFRKRKRLSDRASYQRHKTSVLVRTARNRADRVAASKHLKGAFQANGCKVCGERESILLQAHHVDTSEKEYTMAAIWRMKDLSVIANELSKCVCLCANCHIKVHAGKVVL